MGSERRCRKAEALCARPSEKDAKNEDAGQTALKRLQRKKKKPKKEKKKVAGGKSMTKRQGINKSSKEAHISGICGEMTEENRISQK